MPDENAPVAPQETNQHVSGNRHQLEPDEDQHDVDSRRHAHHAHHGKQQQRIIFAVVFIFHVEIAHRHQDCDGRSRQKQIPEINGEAINQQRVIETDRSPRQRRLNPPHAERRKQHTHKGAPGVDPLPFPRNHQVDQQNAEREDGKFHHRQHQPVFRW
jgi:hypothetical protein